MQSQEHPFYATAKRAFDAGVAAADPAAGVRHHFPDFHLAPLVIAVGKAAVPMAQAASHMLGGLSGAIVVTNPENAKPVTGALVFAAGHPVPDLEGLKAGKAVINAVQTAPTGQPILCLISGGGSALLPAPLDGISLADKAAVNSLLLASGADIVTMNVVRQNLSKLKGGSLLQMAGDRQVTALILSDVIGDDVRAIASGPTASPIGSPNDAINVLQDLGIWGQTPLAVRQALEHADPAKVTKTARNILIGGNTLSVTAMAELLGATHHKTPLEGDVADAVKWVAGLGAGTHVFGGETTVKLTGSGKGGRNQEMALRLALLAEEQAWTGPWLYLQVGTDGRDGPTDAAGGVVTEHTLANIRAAAGSPSKLLANNDAYTALKMGGGLLISGGTGTNVADLGVLIRS